MVPVRVVTFAEVDDRLSIVALVDFSVVMVAEVNVALVKDKLDTVRLPTERLVMSAEAPRIVVDATVPNVVPVSVVMSAEVAAKLVI